MKKLLAFACLFTGLGLANAAQAANPNDGIYYCNFGYEQGYVTLNTGNNTGYLALLSLDQSWSYAIGNWSGNQLSGRTNANGEFSAEFNGQQMIGYVDYLVDGKFNRISLTCPRIV
ncbi:hypothetical protein [Chitinilyticum litopenaei]|uniref:hypothetical protein n=1 Tax=Chitinilyticum litopenaei TaxID=1121276 RepID=UPI00040B70EE|nr:hypothetical protein [Chitinilyticum litopenaei]